MAGAAGPAAGGGGGAGDAKPRSSSSFAGAPGGRPSSTSASAGTRYSSDYSRFSHIGAGDEGSDDDSAAPGEWERERGARAGTGPGEGAGTRDAKAGGGQQAIEVHGAQGGGASDVAVAATAGAAHGAPAGGGSAGAAGAPGASAGAAGGEHADNCAIVADAVDSLRPGASGSECNDADSLEDQVERHTAPPGAAPGGGCSNAAHTQSTSTSAGGDSKAVREAAEGATAVEDGDAGPSDHEVEPSYPGYDGERCADNRPVRACIACASKGGGCVWGAQVARARASVGAATQASRGRTSARREPFRRDMCSGRQGLTRRSRGRSAGCMAREQPRDRPTLRFAPTFQGRS